MRHETTDWFGLAMKARAELGDASVTRYGRVSAKEQTIEWHEVDHAEADGLGGMARVLRKLGHAIPELKGDHAEQPARRRRWGYWRDYWRHVRHDPIQWRVPLQKSGAAMSRRPSWILFSAEQTRRIERAALRAGASVNSYLLAALNQVVAEELIVPGTSWRWMVPVNLRGGLSLPDDTANHVSILSLPAWHGMSAQEVQDGLRDLTRRQHDWAFYWTIRFIAKYFGYRGLLKVTRGMSEKSFICGCLTNLGYWHASHPALPVDVDEGWIIVPLVNRSNPVAAGTVTWNGRLSIALDIHPDLAVAPSRIAALFEGWKNLVMNDAAERVELAAA
jgi:hypothetical protein